MIWKWLYPGIGVKRWMALFAAGVGLAGAGVAVLLDTPVMTRVEEAILHLTKALGGRTASQSLAACVLMLSGIGCCVVSIRNLVEAVADALSPEQVRGDSVSSISRLIVQKRYLEKGPRVVAIGGGSGLSVLLRGLKHFTANITAIVTVADDGGSSGRLRREMGMLPPGDIRNCLVALAEAEPLMQALFQHRFSKGELSGHSFGNLFIAALTEMTSDFQEAVRVSSKVLAVRGRVLPSTLENVVLCARLSDGTVVRGETAISRSRGRISSVYLDPPAPRAVPEAVDAIEAADVVVIGPGSLYTSILPNLAVPDIVEAVRRARALKVYVVNVMTQPGETTGYTAGDHVSAVLSVLGENCLDFVILNNQPVPPDITRRYFEGGAEPVCGTVNAAGVRVIRKPLLEAVSSEAGAYVRHDALALAQTIVRLLGAGRRCLFRPR